MFSTFLHRRFLWVIDPLLRTFVLEVQIFLEIRSSRSLPFISSIFRSTTTIYPNNLISFCRDFSSPKNIWPLPIVTPPEILVNRPSRGAEISGVSKLRMEGRREWKLVRVMQICAIHYPGPPCPILALVPNPPLASCDVEELLKNSQNLHSLSPPLIYGPALSTLSTLLATVASAKV